MDFHKQKYGPWSPSLEHVLEAMEGHFITGLGDGQVGARVTARPEAIVEASEVLHGAGANDGVYGQLAELIDGFETPFGMELSVLRIVTSDQAE